MNTHAALLVAVMAGVTMLLRFLPFLLFRKQLFVFFDLLDHLGDRHCELLILVPLQTEPEPIAHDLIVPFQEDLKIFPAQPLQVFLLLLFRIIEQPQGLPQPRRVNEF